MAPVSCCIELNNTRRRAIPSTESRQRSFALHDGKAVAWTCLFALANTLPMDRERAAQEVCAPK
jgi:hypothetical protein